jgi:hypothetical protein
MASNYSWTCPYCNQIATITNQNTSHDVHTFNDNNRIGHLGLFSETIVCPNSNCREIVISASLYKVRNTGNGLLRDGQAVQTWKLRPQSSAKPFPAYIPAPVLQDYEEACLIADLSPKASATLSRRCLQGIIRDFWGIKKSRLVDEIAALEGKIDPVVWQAIDSVRSIGNIGAHMEKDINLIVDVEPREAILLIQLIEVLLKDWYIQRYEREQHMQQVIAAAQAKTEVKRVKPTGDIPTSPVSETGEENQ